MFPSAVLSYFPLHNLFLLFRIGSGIGMGMKIMIVDDHSDMRRMVRSILPEDMRDVVECADGDEAVKQYSVTKPDVVLMDIQMKKRSGFSAAEEIYVIDPKAQIIFVTSYDTPAFRSIAEKLHARGFVSKDNLTAIHQFITSLSHSGERRL